ncbi:hypothetical protein [Paraburkholderia hospita]|jgi:hypothetical protein|nr:hypothetical protein [Paraburkholderia hospita]SKC96208.1 hypothetical protein SAMN05446934_6946 [Paraburkholderia hospita]
MATQSVEQWAFDVRTEEAVEGSFFPASDTPSQGKDASHAGAPSAK